MESSIRFLWLDPMTVKEVRHKLTLLLEEGLTLTDPITEVLNSDRFRTTNPETCPEDLTELSQVMQENFEWFGNVFRIQALWEYISASPQVGVSGLTLRELSNILYWTYRQ